MTGDGSPRDADAPGATLTVTVLLLAWILAFVDRMVILLLVPGIKASLGISDTQVSLLYGSAFSIVFVPAGLFLGRLVDRANRRNLLILGLIGWTVGTIACGLADSFAALFASRMLVGVSQAMLAPASFSLIGDLFPPARRGRPTALLITSASFGAAIANIAGGVLLQLLSKRPPIVLPVIGALAPWQSTLILVGLPGFVLALLFLRVREPRRRASDGPPLEGGSILPLLRADAGTFGLLFAAIAAMYVVGYGLAGWFPVVFMRNAGLPPAQAGAAMGALVLVAAVIAGIGGGWVTDRFAARDPLTGRVRLIRIVLALNAVILLALLAPQNLPLLFAAFVLFAILNTVTSACGYAILTDMVPSEGRGQVVAAYQLIANLVGLGIGPTLIALVTDHVFGDETKLPLSMLVVALPMSIVAILLFALATPAIRRLHAAAAGTPR